MDVFDQQEERSYPAGDPALWARIFSYVRTRWPVRKVTWTVGGEGFFAFPLRPATLVSATDADGNVADVTVVPGMLVLPCGVFTIIADVGSADVPPDAQEAYDRLAAYTAEAKALPAGLNSTTDGDYTASFAATAMSNALVRSGAADLLRPYR